MSIAGKLEEFNLPHLLQVLATSGETGKLHLTRRDSEGIVVFRQGKIVYAASSSARQTLGNLLLCEGLVTEEQLTHALELHHDAEEEKRLGSILLEMSALTEETLNRVVQQQTEKVISEFLSWPSGFFKLENVELTDYGEVEVDAEDFLIREGLSAEALLPELEERVRELRQAIEEPAGAKRPAEATVASKHDLATLKSIMGEIRSPEFTGEISQMILTFAQELFGRGVLFVVRQNGFGVMGQFGVSSGDPDVEASLRQLTIPLEEPSILSEAAERKEMYFGPLAETEWNRRLVEAIGEPLAGHSVAFPLTVNDRVLLVLYGDQLAPSLRPSWLEELELLMLQAGLAMEKDLLAKRIQHYEKLRRRK